jgi:uncharacterized protein DUF6599
MADRIFSSPKPADRVFVRDGLRSYRRTYRVAEVKWGLGTLVVLSGLVAWVAWRGAHPDPALFDVSAALKQGAEAAPASSRGPLPEGLALAGWKEGKIGEYSADNLYVKIDGRAGFFQSFGVKTLHTLTLEAEGETAAGQAPSVDIELYDMAEGKNALGIYSGEKVPGIESTVGLGFTHHFDRNAAFLARGAYYARLIGSDESEAVHAQLARLVNVFEERLPGEAQPWAFQLFVDGLGLPASSVAYVKENAFSFGFARDVFSAQLSPADSNDDMQAFVVAQQDEAQAKALAEQYRAGFASLGKLAGRTPGGVPLAEDEVLKSYAAAAPVERWVVGVRGAPSKREAHEVLERLLKGVAALPPEVKERAVPAPVAEAGSAGGEVAAPVPGEAEGEGEAPAGGDGEY